MRYRYPTRPFNADEFLNKEIYRASCDPCAKQVCSSFTTHAGLHAPPATRPFLQMHMLLVHSLYAMKFDRRKHPRVM